MRPIPSLISDTFGPRLQAVREHRGLSQTELATTIGKSKQIISGWENSTIEVERGDVNKCAQSLRCRIDDLLAPVSAPLPPHPFWTRIKKRLRRATQFNSNPQIE
jgi:transcriptional regulator with XRE-family HTH domain